MLSTVHLYPMDGAVHDVGETETAFGHRDARWNEVIVGVDPDPSNRERIIRWTRQFWDAVHPYASGGAYVNFLMGDEGVDRVKTTYGVNYARLAEVKKRYDPDNLFRVNHNISPR
jgi:FAD/FMN-containing dehydrogenase